MLQKIRDEWFIIKTVFKVMLNHMSCRQSLFNKMRCLSILWEVSEYQLDNGTMKRGTYYRFMKDYWLENRIR